jgi:DNA-binding CsgD family transcriptional regulator
MDSLGSLDTHDYALTIDVMEALGSSLDLSEVLKRTHQVLARKLAADYAAICVTKPGTLTEYEWMVAQMPEKFFTHYDQMAGGDFVRAAVVNQPNLVLRDTEMLPREELERSLMYQRSRELGIHLEHVMAVLLDMGHDGHGGFMLYRDRRRPFSDSDRALLQRLTPVLTSTVRNCRQLRKAYSNRWTMEGLVEGLVKGLAQKLGSECLVLAPPATEIMRTDKATALLESWFRPGEMEKPGLPKVLVERLALLSGDTYLMQPGQDVLDVERPGRKLRVTFIPVEVPSGRRQWALLLQESPYIPACWREKLTKREVEVLGCLLQGWDNRTIADELKCSVDTVKKHLQHIYDKLGVDQRSQLLHQATLR